MNVEGWDLRYVEGSSVHVELRFLVCARENNGQGVWLENMAASENIFMLHSGENSQ